MTKDKGNFLTSLRRWGWSQDDAAIFGLAIPALGSLAAGPLYVLVDTAIIGHLGAEPLAGLALAGVLLNGVLALCNFLAYATTAQVGRYHAAGQIAVAQDVARQALWLATALGVGFMLLGWGLGHAVLLLLSGNADLTDRANSYFQIAVMGLPFALIANAGQGFLRGMQDMRTPLVYMVVGNVLNVLLEVLFIYGFGWGLPGAAAATVLAQGVMGGSFAYRLVQAGGGVGLPALGAMRPLLQMSGEIFVRTAALYSSFVVVSAVLSRMGAESLAAHQVLFQLWIFLALVLDAVAIAGQVIVSRALGAGLRASAIALARRMIGWSAVSGALFAAVLLLLADPLPRIFTPEAAVLERVHAAWPLFALMQPFNGAVFALDGILIGAGDSRFLMWSMLGAALVAVPLVALAYLAGWGIVGIWAALCALIAARLLITGWRFVSGRWAVTGALATGDPESA